MSGGEVEGDNAGLFYYKHPESARHLSSNKYYSPMREESGLVLTCRDDSSPVWEWIGCAIKLEGKTRPSLAFA